MIRLPISSFLLLLLFSNNIVAGNFHSEITFYIDSARLPFPFGVASGDPKSSSVVIWTKLFTLEYTSKEVKWEVASDTLMQNIVQRGTAITDSSSAYTVKISVQNLEPGKTYFYRFEANQKYSATGRTKTAPLVSDKLKFAVVSCNNYTSGYFNAFSAIARRRDIDAVIHLGDYIYEYANKLGNKFKAIRNHIPLKEIITIQDYRTRYGQYRLDEDLQEAHRLHPFITVWDDHEIANNAFKEGAGNHQPNEGSWDERKAVARKVYFEWMPVEDNEQKSIIRKISYGNLADVFMLDERIEERSEQLNHYTDSNYLSSNRFMIGNSQADWLEQGIKNSASKWKVISNQVLFSELDFTHISKKIGRAMDTWDGYPAERQRILDFFYHNKIQNVIVITGDIHSAWAFDLVANPQNKEKYNRKTGHGVIGAEFVGTSVSSSNADERVPRGIATFVGNLAKNKKHNPHLKYNNVVDHGFFTLTLSDSEARADYYFVKTVKKKTDKMRKAVSWSTFYNNNKLVRNRN